MPGTHRAPAPQPPRAGESNGHQPPFALMPPAYAADAASEMSGADGSGNGSEHGADAHGWPTRTEREEHGDRGQDRTERTDRPPLRPGVRGEVGPLIEALHEIFEHDRAVASQGNAARCGICYLHHPRAELVYREAEGFYVCTTCAAQLGAIELPMVRRQQK